MSWKTIVKENNLAIAEKTLSETITAFRFDAEYFQPHYIENEVLIAKKDCKTLDEIADDLRSFGAYSLTNQITYQESGIPFIRCTDVKEGYVDFSRVYYIDDKTNKLLWKSKVEKGTVLLCMSGSVGNCAVAEENWGYPVNSNQDIAKIILKDGINPYFVSAFFNSKYGKLQIMRLPIGSVQQHIFLWQLKTIRVPLVSMGFQEEVANVYKQALTQQKKAEERFVEAEQTLLKEINLEGYRGTDEAISVRNFSEALADNRFDAEYWQPKYDEIEKRVSKVQQEKLGDIVLVKKGVEVGSEAYADEGKDFIRVSDFTIYGIEDVEKKISEELYEGLKENYKPKKGEVLFTKDGTIGISFALNEEVDAIVSGAFLRLKPKIKINNNYLALVLNSFYCKAQIERMSGGAIIAHLKPESAMQVKIPMLSEKKQEELAGKVLEALRLRKEAKALLEKAKRAVEIFVEKDEKEAMDFLVTPLVQ